MESRWHELCRQMVIEITEEEEINHEALEAKRHVPGFLRHVRAGRLRQRL